MNKFLSISAVALIVASANLTVTTANPTKIGGGELADYQQVTARKITGSVTDETGEPLAGVNVKVQGTGEGTVTDADGKFSVTVKDDKQILSFSYIGYITMSVRASQSVLSVQMKEDTQQLAEVVVTAEFGLKRPARAVGSSVQNVKASDIIDSGRDNFVSALQGRVSGLNVVSSGGAPGASTTVTLRSPTSLSGNNQPLYVIDGVPMNNSSFDATKMFAKDDAASYASRNLDFSSRGNDYNPEDIESMTVLKGAAAAALYGSDASNGAIIITTKKGQAGRGKVSYSNTLRWDKSYGIPEVQTKYANGNYGATSYYNISRFGGLYPEGTQFYDNLGAVLQTGFTQRHNISAEAGTDKASLRSGVSYTDQTGVVKMTDYGRLNISLSGKAEITKWLKVESSMQYAGTTNNKARKGTASPLYYALRWPIHDNMANYLAPDGMHMRYPDRYVDTDMYNPLFVMNKNKYYDESSRILGNVVAVITPVKNVFIRGQYGWDLGQQTFETSEHPYFASNNYNRAPGIGGVYNMAKANFTDQSINIIAGWNGSFIDNKLTLSAQAGYHQQENSIDRLSTYGENYAVTDFMSINNCDVATITSRKRATKRRIQAISGQAEIGYSNMAFLTLRFRNDWASTLPLNNNEYFYPAAEGSFVLTELSALSGIADAVNYFKLRGAIAQVGKDTSPLAINPELEATQLTGGGFKYGFTGPNMELKPEMTTSSEIGFEARLLKDRINIDFTAFQTHNADQIVKDFRMSYATGFVLNTRNMGEFKTWGWESHIDGDIVRQKDFRWNVGVNLSQTRSETLSLPVEEFYQTYTNGNTANARIGTMVGKPIKSVTGYDYQRNKNGDVLIDPTSGMPLEDSKWTVLADLEPKLRFGFTTAVTYKDFRLSAMFSGKYKSAVVNGTMRYLMQNGMSMESVKLREQTTPVVFKGIVKDGNENSDNPTVNTIAVTYGLASTIYSGRVPDWIQKDVNYLRLNEVRLSYNVPAKTLKTLTNGLVSNANLYVAGNDLFTLTNYLGVDAVGNTLSAANGGVDGEGYDTFALPSPRGVSCGLSLTF